MITELTFNGLQKEVLKLAAESPDFRYCDPVENNFGSVCKYTQSVDGETYKGCIFGQALLRLQPSLYNILASIDEHGTEDGEGDGSIESVIDQLDLNFTDKEILWCSQVQKNQDRGQTWRDAVNVAI